MNRTLMGIMGNIFQHWSQLLTKQAFCFYPACFANSILAVLINIGQRRRRTERERNRMSGRGREKEDTWSWNVMRENDDKLLDALCCWEIINMRTKKQRTRAVEAGGLFSGEWEHDTELQPKWKNNKLCSSDEWSQCFFNTTSHWTNIFTSLSSFHSSSNHFMFLHVIPKIISNHWFLNDFRRQSCVEWVVFSCLQSENQQQIFLFSVCSYKTEQFSEAWQQL